MEEIQEIQKGSSKYNLETMLTIEDIMEHLHISSKTTVLKLVQLDTFPKIKLGKKYLIPLGAYNKWVKNMVGKEIYL
jgi:hypothetical protein